MTNCPNCGAPIVAAQCEYCGTHFPNWTVEPLAKNEEIIKLVQDGRITPNEARERLGLETLEEKRYLLENQLLAAKTRAIYTHEVIHKLYADALKAMRNYAG